MYLFFSAAVLYVFYCNVFCDFCAFPFFKHLLANIGEFELGVSIRNLERINYKYVDNERVVQICFIDTEKEMSLVLFHLKLMGNSIIVYVINISWHGLLIERFKNDCVYWFY